MADDLIKSMNSAASQAAPKLLIFLWMLFQNEFN